MPDEIVALLRELFERFGGQHREPWDPAFDDSPFEPLRQENFAEELVVDVERLLAMYSTTSSLAVLPKDDRAALFDRIRPSLAGPYRLPVKHELTWTRLRD